MKVLGISEVTINGNAVVQRQVRGVEVGLVLMLPDQCQPIITLGHCELLRPVLRIFMPRVKLFKLGSHRSCPF